ncbi:unnamed protein product [Brassicogethes aeneus]|uniref:P-type domain-containing protein n=1 Tax=Brassicogethes aeneus TaxID=1431903 RepID=A0A9P0AQB3_BRAAE|nr:unnamed protein product [Brassicogethes aeneus]
MRLRDFFKRYRSQRVRQLSVSDSVSFEAFYNEGPADKLNDTKESSLNGDLSLSPAKLNISNDFPQNKKKRLIHKQKKLHSSSLPFCITGILLLGVFFLLPVAYLLRYLGIIFAHQHYILPKEAEHYQPSPVVHSLLNITFIREKIVLPPPPPPDYSQCKLTKEIDRLDCYPQDGVSAGKCEARGCCYIPAKQKPKNYNPLNVPYCFYPPNYNTYNYLNATETAFGMVIFMKRNFKTDYPDDVEILKMIVKYESDTRLHVKIVDPLTSRFEPPYPELPIVDRASTNTLYHFELDLLKSGFKIKRKSDNTTIFDSVNFLNLIYSNQFLQITTKLLSKNIYGIGEHRTNLMLSTEWSQFTLFNHDKIPSIGQNMYGSHPFYMVVENNTKTHGVLLLNSNAMDVILQPTPAITFRPIGGIFDFYFFMGPTPREVTQQYTQLIGLPYLPPYWSLGFHLCRFGYKSLNDTETVMERNIKAGIPLDTQWNDLDYMNNSNDFTFDKTKFKNLPEFIDKLHQRGMHYIPLIDPGVSASEKVGTYPPYDIGIKMDIFVKNSTNQPFIGKVWNTGSTVWPDFTHPITVDYWTKMLSNLHSEMKFDGAWIDMNEPSNFLSGSFTGCPTNSLESPPYVPKIDGGVLNYKTMCMSAKHYAGLHYNVHNLYGLSEAIVTNFALAEIRGKRPVVISRSTFPGLGHYAGHWSGDVVSAWVDMKYTIPQLLSYSLFGIPLMGADICGFNGNTTKSLCNRWMQLGAFYPFSRNHNTDDGIPQDPAALGDLVVTSSKKALSARYAMLPYLYTLFWKAHDIGETVARPLFFEFLNDPKVLSIDEQFLWGPALMIVPVLKENDEHVMAYFPRGIWYNYHTNSSIKSDGQHVNISAPLDTIPLFIRGGYIIPMQTPKQTTTESRKTLINLLVASDSTGMAQGELYWDDGDTLNTYKEKRYSLLKFAMEDKVLRIQNDHYREEYPPNLGSITILGLEKPVSHVTINEKAHHFQFDTVHHYLIVDNLNMSFNKTITVNWEF